MIFAFLGLGFILAGAIFISRRDFIFGIVSIVIGVLFLAVGLAYISTGLPS